MVRNPWFLFIQLVVTILSLSCLGSPQIWHKTAYSRGQTVNRVRSCQIKRAVVLAAPGKIGRLFRHHDRPEVMALRAPDPNTPWTRHVQIAGFVDSHPVGNAATALLATELSFVA